MKVIRNINNNVSLCEDSMGREVIAFGKGIGFIKPPYEVPLSQIDRTFYNINDLNYEGIKDIPISILDAAIQIIDEAQNNLNVTFIPTAALTLADHIHFAIQRLDKQLVIHLTIQEDMKHLYPLEMKEALHALTIIKEKTAVTLDPNEAGNIALHFINSQITAKQGDKVNSGPLMEDVIDLIEKQFRMAIDKEGFNYSRFATHIDYLVQRVLRGEQIKSDNAQMFEALKEEYPGTYACVLSISEMVDKRLKFRLSNEEELYLILHINRLCSREENTLRE
ncbi:PRD domain-containing protein [uncultured Vagococcus sp.]|uniref:PRD domain-containing protein n=1 Tax=uncultured Vagococcus sp. TaxID=189676 RepID=UPI0028D35FCE|nr:PRD domain-containing protein [uncultured Vagococcus sp.]